MSFISDENATLAEVRSALRLALTPKYGEREAQAISRTVLMTLKGWDLPRLLADESREAGPYVVNRCREILDNLLKDMPLQYALKETNFYGLKLNVGPGVLIPRPETEELVDLIVKENDRNDLHVLDLCSGSGAIAFALARNLPFSEVEAVEISPEALSIARENAGKLKINVKFKEDDIFKLKLPADSYDLIVSNPPYVDESEKADMEPNVLNYEPHSALFVPDSNPLVFYDRIAKLAAEALVQGGKLYLEINPRHSEQLKKLLESKGLVEVEILRDVHGKERFAKALKS